MRSVHGGRDFLLTEDDRKLRIRELEEKFKGNKLSRFMPMKILVEENGATTNRAPEFEKLIKKRVERYVPQKLMVRLAPKVEEFNEKTNKVELVPNMEVVFNHFMKIGTSLPALIEAVKYYNKIIENEPDETKVVQMKNDPFYFRRIVDEARKVGNTETLTDGRILVPERQEYYEEIKKKKKQETKVKRRKIPGVTRDMLEIANEDIVFPKQQEKSDDIVYPEKLGEAPIPAKTKVPAIPYKDEESTTEEIKVQRATKSKDDGSVPRTLPTKQSRSIKQNDVVEEPKIALVQKGKKSNKKDKRDSRVSEFFDDVAVDDDEEEEDEEDEDEDGNVEGLISERTDEKMTEDEAEKLNRLIKKKEEESREKAEKERQAFDAEAKKESSEEEKRNARKAMDKVLFPGKSSLEFKKAKILDEKYSGRIDRAVKWFCENSKTSSKVKDKLNEIGDARALADIRHQLYILNKDEKNPKNKTALSSAIKGFDEAMKKLNIGRREDVVFTYNEIYKNHQLRFGDFLNPNEIESDDFDPDMDDFIVDDLNPSEETTHLKPKKKMRKTDSKPNKKLRKTDSKPKSKYDYDVDETMDTLDDADEKLEALLRKNKKGKKIK